MNIIVRHLKRLTDRQDRTARQSRDEHGRFAVYSTDELAWFRKPVGAL